MVCPDKYCPMCQRSHYRSPATDSDRKPRDGSLRDDQGTVHDYNRVTGKWEPRRGLLGTPTTDSVPFTGQPDVPRTPFVGPQAARDRFTGELKRGPDGRQLRRPPPG